MAPNHGSEATFLPQPELRKLLNVGPTGQFPRGKLNDDDEGEIRTAMALSDLIRDKAFELRGISK